MPEVWIPGSPYAQAKTRGDLEAPARWSAAVVEHTRHLPPVLGPTALEVEFVLPPDKFPRDLPYGMDLDNLLKRLFDALAKTVLSQVEGKDSAIVHLTARKRKARAGEATGARVDFTSVDPLEGV